MNENTAMTTTTQQHQINSSTNEKKKDKKHKKNLRYAGGQVWEDASLNEWDNGMFIYTFLFLIF